MPKKPKENLSLKEAEIAKIEELNRREKKALAERVELIRQKKELEEAELEESADPETPAESRPLSFADETFIKVAESLTGAGSLHISRVTQSGVARVATYPIVDVPTMEQQIDAVARNYGGGTFLIDLRNPDGTYAKQKQVVFDEKAYKAPENPEARRDASNDRLLELMMESRRESNELLKTLLAGMVAQKPASPFGNMTIADIISLVKTGGSSVDMKGTMELITKAMTWGREMAEGRAPGTDEGEPNVLKDLVAPALAALSQLAPKATAKQPPALPRPNVPGTMPKPLPGNPEPVAQEETMDPSVAKIKSNLFYKLYVPSLLKAANANTSPEDVAEDILSTVPETYHGMVLKMAESPDVVDYLASFEPEARTHDLWVKAVAACIVRELTYEEEAEAEAGAKAPAETAKNGHGDVPASVLVKA